MLKANGFVGIPTKLRGTMKSDIHKFFALQREIFGICPDCQNFFRLSDCKIFSKKKPVLDWMDEIKLENERIDTLFSDQLEKEEEFREKAREKGRCEASETIKKIDPIFTPRKLNPDDAKVLFHPIDYIVFNGMKETKEISNIVFLDRQTKQTYHRRVQESIEQVIDKENYEWQTLRVHEDGKIKVEK